DEPVQEDMPLPRLIFQGERKARGSRFMSPTGVGASVFSKKLRLYFFGRRGRAYELTLPYSALLSSPHSIPGKLRYTPRSKKLLCGRSASGARMSRPVHPPRHPQTAAVLGDPLTVEIALAADAEYRALHGRDTLARLHTILNNV